MWSPEAYATLAADAMYCAPTPIQRITAADGTKLRVGQPQCARATSKEVAREALDAARCPAGDRARLGACHGATAPEVRSAVGYPVFGKTGTTDADNTASMVVGTPDVTVAGYLGQPGLGGTPRPHEAQHRQSGRLPHGCRLHERSAAPGVPVNHAGDVSPTSWWHRCH